MDSLGPDERRLLDGYLAARTPDGAAIAKALATALHRAEHGPAFVLPENDARPSHVVWARVAMFAIAAAAVVLIAWRGIAALERTQAPEQPGDIAPLVVEPVVTGGEAEVRVPDAKAVDVPAIVDVDAPIEPAIEPPLESPRATTPKKPRPPASLADELALLRDADDALDRGLAARALALLDQHAKRFPRGQMVPERMLQRAIALCRLGKRDKSRAAIDKLLRAFPTTPLRARANDVCKDAP
jgi:hypothetical protein